jgi:SAM-dependent methyltransferase
MSSHYDFKASPFSSHSLLLAAFGSAGAGRRVLDLGCGNAYLGAILAERGFEVVGVERSGWYDPPGPPGVRIVEGDLEQGIPEVGGGFDYVMCADILEHLREPERLLDRARPLLKPGGRVIASLPNSGNLYFRLNILLGRFPQEDKGLFDRTHVRFFMWEGWQALFARCGFVMESVHPSGIPVGLALPSFDGSLPVRWAEWFCYHAARVWKTLFAYQFIVVAKPVRG